VVTLPGGKEIARLRHNGTITEFRFTKDEKYIGSASRDWYARIWEIGTGKEVARVRHQNIDVVSITLSSDEKFVSSTDFDGNIFVWLWRPEDLIAEACGHLTKNLSQGEWNHYLAPAAYHRTCELLSIPPG